VVSILEEKIIEELPNAIFSRKNNNIYRVYCLYITFEDIFSFYAAYTQEFFFSTIFVEYAAKFLGNPPDVRKG
jgi:hypothetical protein